MIMKELYAQLGISSAVYDFGKTVEDSLKERFEKFDKTAEYNQMKVIRAMHWFVSAIQERGFLWKRFLRSNYRYRIVKWFRSAWKNKLSVLPISFIQKLIWKRRKV